MADVTKEGKAPGTVTGARVRTPKGTTEVKAPGSSPTASMPAKGKGAGKSKAAATPKAGTKGKAPAAEAEVDPEYAPHESGKAWSELADYHAGEAASATDVHARGHHEGMSYAANL
ncbi:MAG: hypothetical protein VKL39_13115, partial [Leptolyngbyaceae bacterium]|nr:hypothetical protein [Leptolyngbyaceae bacterium]